MREVRVDCKNTGGVEQRMIVYSLSLIAGYSIAKWATPRSPQLLTRHLHIHHWIWSTFFLVGIFISTYFVESELNNWVIGLATGVALQGLSYKNWGIKRGGEN